MRMPSQGSRKEFFILRREFLVLFKSGNQRGSENEGGKAGKEGMEGGEREGKEGEGRGGGRKRRLTNKQKKIPKSIRAEAPKQINVAMATGGCVGGSERTELKPASCSALN